MKKQYKTKQFVNIKITLLLCFIFFKTIAQNKSSDSISNRTINYKSFILPSTLIGYGLVALHNPALISFDNSIQKNFDMAQTNHIDDVTMLLPAASVYGLNMFGIKGKHNFKINTLIFGTASVIVLGSVLATKSITKKERPNGESNDSFPSGHTAISFMGAEFLYQEYKHLSIWYGIIGYGIATSTAYLRVHNNKHWFSDVVAGAGFGILSTKIAYALHPYLQRKLFKSKTATTIINPFYNGEHIGLSFMKNF